MKLTLLRHGTAQDFHPAGDFHRELVEKGRRQARHAGAYFRNRGWQPDLVLTSPYLRAAETARLFCDEGGFASPEEAEFLGCGMSFADAAAGLRPHLHLERVVAVGHQPDFGELVCWLTGLPGSEVEVGKGSLWELELSELRPGAAQARYYLSAGDLVDLLSVTK